VRSYIPSAWKPFRTWKKFWKFPLILPPRNAQRDYQGHFSRENCKLNSRTGSILPPPTCWKGYLLVTRSQYPELSEEVLTIRVEQMKMDAWLELNDNLTALENIKVLNHIIFHVHNFDGNKINLFVPQNFYLNTFLETRKGSALSLGMLYIILAQKLNIPVYWRQPSPAFYPGLCVGTDSRCAFHWMKVLFYINPL